MPKTFLCSKTLTEENVCFSSFINKGGNFISLNKRPLSPSPKKQVITMKHGKTEKYMIQWKNITQKESGNLDVIQIT
jgi:hypothetical protein